MQSLLGSFTKFSDKSIELDVMFVVPQQPEHSPAPPTSSSLHHQDELSSVSRGGSKSSTPTKSGTPQSSQPKTNSLTSSQGASSTSDAHSSNSQYPADGVSAADSPASGEAASGTPASAATSDAAVEPAVDSATKGQEVSDDFNPNLDSSSEKPEGSKDISAVQEAQQAGEEASTMQDDGA